MNHRLTNDRINPINPTLPFPTNSEAAAPKPVPLIDLTLQYQTIRDEIQEAVQRVFESQAFVLGEEVTLFEEDVAQYCDSRAAIGCASGSDALLLSLMGLGIGPGDEVITTPFTFFATASAIERVGAIPVFVDIDPESFNLLPDEVERAVTRNTKAIIPVHLFGQCAEMDALWRIATHYNLALIEDAAQAIGSEYRGRRTGVLGTIGCFSFFPTKNLGGAGDGGMMTTDNLELAERIRALRVHGDVGGYHHKEVGINSRLDALQAAVLKVKLKHLDTWSQKRQYNASRYEELLTQEGVLGSVLLPKKMPERNHVYNQFVVRIKNQHRDHVLNTMKELNLGAAVYYPEPLHLQECFQHLGYQTGDFPNAEQACSEVLALPIFPELTDLQLEQVVAGVVQGVDTAVQPVRLRPAA